MQFITNKVEDQAACDWDAVYEEAAQYQRAKITVEEYSDKNEISEQQRKWLHCRAGPIQELMREGWSFRDAKEYLKVEYGREWFVKELTDENFRAIEGVFRWECRKAICRKLSHPMNIFVPLDGPLIRPRIYHCPYCHSIVYPIAIQSIMFVSPKKVNLWFDEIFAHMPKILPPDKEWKKKLQS